ncbi:FtsX-like permease family protein [Micromonospora sp. NPDC003197]
MTGRGGGMGALRRVWAFRGHYLLVAVLAMAVALLVTSVPRIANRLTDEGLREQMAGQPPTSRDITYTMATPMRDQVGPERLAVLRKQMSPEVSRLVGEEWFTAQTPPSVVERLDPDSKGFWTELALRASSGIETAATIVDGRWPDTNPSSGEPVEVAMAESAAAELGMRAGHRLRTNKPGVPALDLKIVGIFRPHDPGNGVWDSLPPTLQVVPPPDDGMPYTAVVVTNFVRLQALMNLLPTSFEWRYRVDPARFDAAQAEAVIDALVRLNRTLPGELKVTQGIDKMLREFLAALASARTVLAIISAGVLATLAGLIGLSAGLIVRRRREEFGLLRARGGGWRSIAGRSLAEALLVVPLAMALGWAVGLAVPGRASGTAWYVVLGAVLITLAVPLAVGLSRPSHVQRRQTRGPAGLTRRLTVEISVLVLAVLGTVLLYRRGLTSGAVDPLLMLVPVLLAVGVALVVLRVYPWPVRLFGRLSARGRGTVAFLGLARASRSVASTPLIVVILAVATTGFCAVARTAIEDGRDRAADHVVPADALLTADRLAPDTAEALAALPGVRAVTGLTSQSGQRIMLTDGGASGLDEVQVMVLDLPAFRRLAAEAGIMVELPATLTGAVAGSGPVPALASPEVAAELSGPAAISVQNRRYEFQIAAVEETFPMIARSSERFLVLPAQALPSTPDQQLVPTGFLVAGEGYDPAALQQAGVEGQQRYYSSGLGTGRLPGSPPTLTEWSRVRAELAAGGANGLLFFGFGAGAVGGGVLGLLAVAFVVLAGAGARGRVLSRLRTMGLSARQWRGLLLMELAPLLGVSLLTGAAVGALLPLVLTPVLGLSTFTDGLPVRISFEPTLVVGIAVFGVLALLVATVLETTINRRMRLGDVLRLGEETP